LDASLEVTNQNTLRVHDENANVQAQLNACYQETTHLKGQKEAVEQELGAVKHDVLVRETILELINLTDATKQPSLPFENLPLEQVAARLDIGSWADISALSFNATHRATMVCNVLGLARNHEFKELWTAPSDRKSWSRHFGSVPDVQTGRKASVDELKVRLAYYLRIQPPQEVIDRVLGDSLSSVEEGQGGEESGEEEVEAPIPESIGVSSKKRARSSLEEASEEDLLNELRRRKAASSVGEDNTNN
jgi:hypothetical protein